MLDFRRRIATAIVPVSKTCGEGDRFLRRGQISSKGTGFAMVAVLDFWLLVQTRFLNPIFPALRLPEAQERQGFQPEPRLTPSGRRRFLVRRAGLHEHNSEASRRPASAPPLPSLGASNKQPNCQRALRVQSTLPDRVVKSDNFSWPRVRSSSLVKCGDFRAEDGRVCAELSEEVISCSD
jgi:hypothetical protein